METVRCLAAQTIWARHDHIGGGDSPDVEWLEVLEHLAAPLARQLHGPQGQVPAGGLHRFAPGPTPKPPDCQSVRQGGQLVWRWAQRRWPHTREWSAARRFHLDGRQEVEVIEANHRANSPTTAHLCPLSALHQIRELTIHTVAEARAAYAALVREFLQALCSVIVRHLDKARMP